MLIGVLAVQGDVSEHVDALKRVCDRVEVVLVRKRGIIPECDGIVIPGGESTTFCRLLEKESIWDEIVEAVKRGVPVLATCAGLILLSKEVIDSAPGQRTLGVLNVKVRRNAFGRQRESFEAMVNVKDIGEYRGVFIRAPVVEEVENGVDVISKLGDKIVGVRQNNIIGFAFHPELTDDTRIHSLFLDLVRAVEGRMMGSSSPQISNSPSS
ncbi:pyridoxal 5'-phosphate synthase glutaminase subunit PdxT [Methanosarcinales archaeon]|nr:MAG: pyridoxal 5'-phosphate synthase glutaminase subunit PdxT [Methanosarcinales archaeon]